MSELIPLVALWENKSKRTGKQYWSGKLGEAKVLMFRQTSEHPNAPAFKIFIAEPTKPDDTPEQEPGPDAEFPEIPF